MDDQQFQEFLNIQKTLSNVKSQEVSALNRIALSLETLLMQQQASQGSILGRGFQKKSADGDNMAGAQIVYVGAKAGGYFYTLGAENIQEPFEADSVEFTLMNARLIYKPVRNEGRVAYGESWKMQLMMATDKGQFILEFGVNSGFGYGIVKPLLELSDEQWFRRILLVPLVKEVQTSVLVKLFVDGELAFVNDRIEGKWADVWMEPTFQFLRRLKSLRSLEFPYPSSEEFYASLKGGERMTTASRKLKEQAEAPQLVSSEQISKMWAIAEPAGYTKAAVRALLQTYGLNQGREVTLDLYPEICRKLADPETAEVYKAAAEKVLVGAGMGVWEPVPKP